MKKKIGQKLMSKTRKINQKNLHVMFIAGKYRSSENDNENYYKKYYIFRFKFD